MSLRPSRANHWGSQDFFSFSEQIISAQSLAQQCNLISKLLKQVIGGELSMWLSDIFHRLAAESLPEWVVFGKPTPRTSKALKSLKVTMGRKTAQGRILVIPLHIQQKAIGVIQIKLPKDTPLSDDQMVFIRGFAPYCAMGLYILQLRTTTDWRYEQLAILHRMSMQVTRQLSDVHLYQNIVDLIQQTFHYYSISLYTVDASIKKLKLQAYSGADLNNDRNKEVLSIREIPLGKGLVGRAAELKHQALIQNVKKDKHYRMTRWLSATQAEMVVPLKYGEEILGVLDIQSDQLFAFNDDDCFIMEALASSISVTLHNAKLYQSSIEQVWISTVFQQINETVRDKEDINSLMDSVTRTTPLLIGIKYCAIYLRDKFSGLFNLISHNGFNSKQVEILKSLPYTESGTEIFKNLRKKQADFVQIPLTLLPRESLQEEGFLLLPLLSRNELLGSFLVNSSVEMDRGFIQETKENNYLMVLQSIAHQTAVALENIQLKESNQMEAYVNAVLLQVAQITATSHNLLETIQTITDSMPFLVGAETILIYTYDADQTSFLLRGVNSAKYNKELLKMEKHIRNGEFPLLDDLILQQKPKYLLHGDCSPSEWHTRLYTQPVFSSLKMIGEHPDVLFGMPLVIRGEALGVMLLSENSKNYVYREKRHEIIIGVSQQLALAVKDDQRQQEVLSNERMKREIQLAQQIQRTFLPEELPRIPNWDLDVRWRPALQVSGDFYDIVHLPDDRWGLVIADVSDKGLSAALYMTVTRTLVHASALDGDLPAKTLQQVNQLLVESSQEGLFTTIFYALLDASNGEIIYCNAGHNSPFVLRASTHNLDVVSQGGTALGTLADIQLDDEWLVLQPGDSLILYTDGITEARGANNKLYGLSRLKAFLHKEFNKNIIQMLDDLDADLARFTLGRNPSDDVTVMGLQRIK